MRSRVTVLVVMLISLSSAAAQQAPLANPAQTGKLLIDDQAVPVRHPKRARHTRREDSTLTVRVYDYARLDRTVLVNTTRQAGRIFQKAGVETDWLLCSPLDPPMPQVCNAPIGPADLVLRIVRRARSLDHSSGMRQCGVALEDIDGRGAYGTLYADCLEIRPEVEGLRASEFLGHLVAHEIGHLLLPAGEDSPGGVMRDVERPEEWKLAVKGRLNFTAQQARALRAEARMRTELALAESGEPGDRKLAESQTNRLRPRNRKEM